MKKLLALLLAVVLVFGLVACSTDNKKENSTDGTISETQTDTTPSTENTETTEPSTEVTTPSEETPDGTEETTPPTEGSTNTESKPTEETLKKEDNKKEDTKTETTTSPTERPVVKDEDLDTSSQTKDDTMFNSYESFIQKTVSSESHSLNSAPSNLSSLKPICDCNIKFTGNLKSGTVEVVINGVGHGHGWAVAEYNASTGTSTGVSGIASAGVTVSSPNGQMLVACGECGFVKGENFIYVKIPGKNHGHGWSWPTDEVKPVEKCNCLSNLTGDFNNGSYSVGNHSHSWATTVSHSVGSSVANGTGSTTISKSEGWSESHSTSVGVSTPSAMTGVPPCHECGFRKYENVYGDKIITFKCTKTGESHTVNFTTTHKIGEKVNCICGLTTSGNASNGSFSFSSKYSDHGHAWASSSNSWPSTSSSTISSGVSQGIGSSQSASHSSSEGWSTTTGGSSIGSVSNYRCSCEREEVNNGFIVKCPATNKYHVIKYS